MTAETATVSSLEGACERKTLQGWFCEDAFTLMMLCSECAVQMGKKKEKIMEVCFKNFYEVKKKTK